MQLDTAKGLLNGIEGELNNCLAGDGKQGMTELPELVGFGQGFSVEVDNLPYTSLNVLFVCVLVIATH